MSTLWVRAPEPASVVRCANVTGIWVFGSLGEVMEMTLDDSRNAFGESPEAHNSQPDDPKVRASSGRALLRGVE